MKKILIIIILMGLTACNTQAKKYEGEPETCFQSRFHSREKNHDTARLLAEECPKEIKREWCLKVLQERPGVFKDFNDCWRQ
jgi:hypothetical protein